MNCAGSGIAAANAREAVKRGIEHVTKNPGGGAVREAVELLLKAQVIGANYCGNLKCGVAINRSEFGIAAVDAKNIGGGAVREVAGLLRK